MGKLVKGEMEDSEFLKKEIKNNDFNDVVNTIKLKEAIVSYLKCNIDSKINMDINKTTSLVVLKDYLKKRDNSGIIMLKIASSLYDYSKENIYTDAGYIKVFDNAEDYLLILDNSFIKDIGIESAFKIYMDII